MKATPYLSDIPNAETAAIGFLTWVDTLERLDTLLLECRHVQQNIIYLLRAPILYRPLRYEEQFLWRSEAWNGLLKKRPDLWGQTRDFAYSAIITYPELNSSEEVPSIFHHWQHHYSSHSHTMQRQVDTGKANKVKLEKDWDELQLQMQEIVGRLINDATWSREQQSNYDNLVAIQNLKRHIFFDKVLLCVFGVDIFRDKNRAANNDSFCRFLVLRSVIQARARMYVERLGDHQAIFAHSQDIGLQDHPRPSVRRRREQGIYSVYLQDQCSDIGREMTMFLEDICNERRIQANQHYVNTSYWMPERPDLQSVISHEVAHAVVRDWFDDLSYQALDAKDNEFTRTLKQLKQCLDIFEVDEVTGHPVPFREIVVDILATVIRGPAYIYALFLELLGDGLEDIFACTANPDVFELRVIEYLEGAFGFYGQARDWYYRLHLVCTWLEAIQVSDASNSLTLRLIGGCRGVLNVFETVLEAWAAPGARRGEYWRTLTEQLCKLLRQSKVLPGVRRWIAKRRVDYIYWKNAEWHQGKCEFPRFSQPLDPRVRNFVLQGFRQKKLGLLKDKEQWTRHCKCIYNINEHEWDNSLDYSSPNKGIAPPLICQMLFEDLNDIPWQCGLLRAFDFTHMDSDISPSGPEEFLRQMHEESALGRELYQLALDFYIHDTEPSSDRLAEAIRALSPEFRSNLSEDNIRDEIDKWARPLANRDLEDKTNRLIDSLRKLSRWPPPPVSEWEIPNLHPRALLAATHRLGSEKSKRWLMRLQGHKIEELVTLLSGAKDPRTVSLSAALSIHDTQNMERVRNRLLCAFAEENGASDAGNVNTYLLSRICTAGSYTKQNNEGLYTRREMFLKDHWPHQAWFGGKRSYHVLLGRYDVFTTNKARPMVRFAVPCFDVISACTRHEHFPSYFVRREIALPVRLGQRPWKEVEDADILGMLSIHLNRVSARLSFLYRLLDTIDNAGGTRTSITPLPMDNLAGLISDAQGDRAFLSDGWGDILLVFGGKAESRLQDLFTIQSALFEDFQVDRTELILRPDCLDFATEKQNEFFVYATIRLMESRTLDKPNEKFCDNLNRCISHCTTPIKCSIARTPGRMDYMMTFEGEFKYTNLLECVHIHEDIDRLQTNIGRRL